DTTSVVGIRIGEGGTILTPDRFEFSNMYICVTDPDVTFVGDTEWVLGENAVFRIDKPLVLDEYHSIVIKNGGLLTHTPGNPGAVQTYGLDVLMGGSLTVEEGGRIDVSARGFTVNNGPGTATSNCGGSYGGLGVNGLDCYGSIVAPIYYGSGGRGNNAAIGGGVMKLNVAGFLQNDGAIAANAAQVTQHTGAGGSVYIISGSLLGSGVIEANSSVNVTGSNPGGGGRISITLTEPEAKIADFAGSITAFGGQKANGVSGGAGTIYLRDGGQAEDEGVLIVDNKDLVSLGTELDLSLAGIDLDKVKIKVTGNLKLLEDLAVHDILLESPNAILDLGLTSLYIGTAEHPFEPESVINWGSITWWKPPQGSVFRVR
ncbi:MAG: hypothetical protein GX811_00540, partial [Lentisphaerae bacterium]|nr:hypothetical protein [Lentisphaerota bacterium]